MVTITVRVIKSFEYRTIKNYVIHDIDLQATTGAELLEKVRAHVQTSGVFRPYRTTELNALKIYWHPHLTKTQNLAINLDNPEWLITDYSKPLSELGLVNESEVSCFNLDMYKQYEQNPVNKWE